MTLAGAWVAFPLLLAAIATGWGLLVAAAAGSRLPAALVPGIGLCALAAALTLTSATEPDLALTVTVCGALSGLALRVLAPAPRPDRPRSAAPAAAAAIVFGALAAPIVLTGSPAVSGYIRLDDTATFVALGDWILGHGRSTAGLAPSTYEATLQSYLAGGYPTGATLPLVAAGRLMGVELLWLWAPFLAVLGALLAAAIAELVRPLVADGRIRAAVAVLASCSALLLGYVLWGGVKEIWTAAIAALLAALVSWTTAHVSRAGRSGGLRALLPMAVGAAGLVCALSVAGLVWAAPSLVALAAGVAVARGHGRRVPVVLAGALVLGAALIPLVQLAPFVEGLSNAPSSGTDWLGNLLRPLRLQQVGGIWPARDFRVDPASAAATTLLLIVVAAGAGYGLWRAISLRAQGMLAYAGLLASAAVVLATTGWAWGEGKALAIASPVPLALAGAGAAQLLGAGRGPRLHLLGASLLAALVVGVGWSYALAFQGTTLSPFGRHDELARIGERFAGRGPALATEYDPYAGRWLLRRLDPEVASELRRRTVQMSDGTVLAKGRSADIDSFALQSLDPYRLLVLRRSPAASRPPSTFRRLWSGRWYEVWERRDGRQVLEHLGLGNAIDPTAIASCADVRRMARAAGPGGSLRAARTAVPAVAGFDRAALPAGWTATAGGALFPDDRRTGTARATVSVPSARSYDVWVGGAFRGGARVAVDGVVTGGARHELGYPGNWVPFGSADISAGPHAVTVRLDGRGIHPGVHGIIRYAIGPVALVPAGAKHRVLEVPAANADRLCGKRLDWLEAVR